MKDTEKMKLGYCCGVFDLGHIGHMRVLKNSKRQCDCIIIGLVTDDAVKKQKGDSRPILTYKERKKWLYEMGYHNIVKQETFDPSDNLIKFRPNVFIKGKDQTHISEKTAKDLDIEIIYLKRTNGISTSDIIKRIRNDSIK